MQILKDNKPIIGYYGAIEEVMQLSMAGNITNEIVSKLGMKNLSKGILVEVLDDCLSARVACIVKIQLIYRHCHTNFLS